MAADVDAAVQAAIGGLAATQILEGDRRFDFVIRYQPRVPHARRRRFATFCCPRRTATTFRSVRWPTSRCTKALS